MRFFSLSTFSHLPGWGAFFFFFCIVFFFSLFSLVLFCFLGFLFFFFFFPTYYEPSFLFFLPDKTLRNYRLILNIALRNTDNP